MGEAVHRGFYVLFLFFILSHSILADEACDALVEYSNRFRLLSVYDGALESLAGAHRKYPHGTGFGEGVDAARISGSFRPGESFFRTVCYQKDLSMTLFTMSHPFFSEALFDAVNFASSAFVFIMATNSVFTYSTFIGAFFFYSSFASSEFPNSNFEGAIFRCVDLRSADLSGSVGQINNFGNNFCAGNIYDSLTRFPPGMTCPPLSIEQQNYRLRFCDEEKEKQPVLYPSPKLVTSRPSEKILYETFTPELSPSEEDQGDVLFPPIIIPFLMIPFLPELEYDFNECIGLACQRAVVPLTPIEPLKLLPPPM